MSSTNEEAWGNPSHTHTERGISTAYEKWLGDLFKVPAAYVTLTLKQGQKLNDGTWARITREIASKQLAWFFRNLDRRVYKSAAIRFGKRLGRIVFLEGGADSKRLHAHVVLEMPDPARMSETRFRLAISDIWSIAEWGYDQIDFEICYWTPGAIEYSLKTGVDALDLELCQPPQPKKLVGTKNILPN